MNAKATLAIVMAGALGATLACSTLNVTTDYDRQADFAGFKTFRFMEGNRVGNSFVEKRIQTAVTRELEAKGIAMSQERADVLVVFYGRMSVERHVDVTSGGYAGRWGRWGMGTSSATVRDIPVGSLIVDLVDAASKELVWRGTASDTVGDPDKSEKLINEAVAKMFAGFPPGPAGAK
jgi:hypothetical protein